MPCMSRYVTVCHGMSRCAYEWKRSPWFSITSLGTFPFPDTIAKDQRCEIVDWLCPLGSTNLTDAVQLLDKVVGGQLAAFLDRPPHNKL
jgi:hypothetical protein